MELRSKAYHRSSQALETAARKSAAEGREAPRSALGVAQAYTNVVRNVYPTRLDEPRVRENLERLIRAARAFDAQSREFATPNAPGTKSGRGRRARPR